MRGLERSRASFAQTLYIQTSLIACTVVLLFNGMVVQYPESTFETGILTSTSDCWIVLQYMARWNVTVSLSRLQWQHDVRKDCCCAIYPVFHGYRVWLPLTWIRRSAKEKKSIWDRWVISRSSIIPLVSIRYGWKMRWTRFRAASASPVIWPRFL